MTTSPPSVCVVVLNYNGKDHLNYCLPSIRQTEYSNLRVLVVDNASADNSLEKVPSLCPEAVMLPNKRNLGWAGGNNVGIRAALKMGSDYIVLANNDIIVDPRWIRVAVDCAEANPRLGVLGFDIHEPMPGSIDRDAGFELARLSWRGPAFEKVERVGGMAMFVRAKAFETVGLIDESFFAYGEEVDFQMRLGKAGYAIGMVNVPVWHHGQGSFGRFPLRSAMLQTRNNIQLLLKHESFSGILGSAIRHVWNRCFRNAPDSDKTSAVERRLRAFGRPSAFLVLLYAAWWNLSHLPFILRRRFADNRSANDARLKFEEAEGAEHCLRITPDRS